MLKLIEHGGCLAIAPHEIGTPECHAKMDAYGKANGLTVVYCPWHPNPEYRMSETGSFLSRNDQYPSGLVIVDEKGKPEPWKPTC